MKGSPRDCACYVTAQVTRRYLEHCGNDKQLN